MTKMKLKPGVLTGSAVKEVFAYMKEVQCALPAVNVIGSHSTTAAFQAAKEANAPVIVQYSNGGAQFNAGKAMPNDKLQACVAGAVAGAHYVLSLIHI